MTGRASLRMAFTSAEYGAGWSETRWILTESLRWTWRPQQMPKETRSAYVLERQKQVRCFRWLSTFLSFEFTPNLWGWHAPAFCLLYSDSHSQGHERRLWWSGIQQGVQNRWVPEEGWLLGQDSHLHHMRWMPPPASLPLPSSLCFYIWASLVFFFFKSFSIFRCVSCCRDESECFLWSKLPCGSF